MLMSIIIVTVCGILGAGILVLASIFLAADAEDARKLDILAALPGANCGACGYAGCADYAGAVNEGAPCNLCIPGKAATAAKLAEIMGTNAGGVAARKAVVACQGDCDKTHIKFKYEGISSCHACNALYRGDLSCESGCLGYGDCSKACPFDAIVVENGLARVDQELCTGCGACEKVCPKHIIWIRPEEPKPVVMCANHDRGPETKKVCSTGCIACKICEKNCEAGAIVVNNNVARIDYSKCTECGVCVAKCPTKAIQYT